MNAQRATTPPPRRRGVFSCPVQLSALTPAQRAVVVALIAAATKKDASATNAGALEVSRAVDTTTPRTS